ncbi:unnamed protein product [Urochloa humidicola]
MSTPAGGAAATARTAGQWPRLRCSWLRRPLMGQDEAPRVLLSAGRRHPESSAPCVREGSAPPSRRRCCRRLSAPKQDAFHRAICAGEGRRAGPRRRADLPTRCCWPSTSEQTAPRRRASRAAELAVPPPS